MTSLLTLMLLGTLAGQVPCDGVVVGTVVDARNRQPIERARVDAGETINAVRTDQNGRYRLEGLCPGEVRLRVVRSAYALRVLKITVTGQAEANVSLVPMRVVQGDDVLVQAPRLKASDTRSVVSLEGDELLRTRGESLADALANLP